MDELPTVLNLCSLVLPQASDKLIGMLCMPVMPWQSIPMAIMKCEAVGIQTAISSAICAASVVHRRHTCTIGLALVVWRGDTFELMSSTRLSRDCRLTKIFMMQRACLAKTASFSRKPHAFGCWYGTIGSGFVV